MTEEIVKVELVHPCKYKHKHSLHIYYGDIDQTLGSVLFLKRRICTEHGVQTT